MPGIFAAFDEARIHTVGGGVAEENPVEPSLVPPTAMVDVALVGVGVADAQGPGYGIGFALVGEGAVRKVLVVLVALSELDTKVRKDAITEDVDAALVGNKGNESVEFEDVRCLLTSRVVWTDVECAGFVDLGSVRKFTHDLRLPILGRSNWNATPPSFTTFRPGVLGIAIKDSCVEQTDEISASFQNLRVTVECLVVIE
mmetsp:Transcript_3991/g.11345  ORF Transcript_3991/g.11345 Transcript_3991/m.11345 type:complete len:200 (+) Transcript_3991:602-1201(+)